MADSTTDIELTLRAIDEASGPIREVGAALEGLAGLNLSGVVGQLEGVGRALETLSVQAEAFGERMGAVTQVVKEGMAAQTAQIQAEIAQQRDAFAQHAQAMETIVRDAQTTLTAIVEQGQKEQGKAVGQGSAEVEAAFQKQWGEALAEAEAFWAEYERLAQQGARSAAAALQQAQQATAQATGSLYTRPAGATTAAAGTAERESGFGLLPRILGEKGPVGGGAEIPGVDVAQQFLIWGTVFELYSKVTQAATNLASAVFTSNASFQEVGATLTAIYGGAGPAQAALAWMDSFAEATPFTRDQVRQAGIAFAAQGDDIRGALTAAGDLSAAMHNTGGIMDATRAIVDAQNNQFRMLRDELHVTVPELEKFGLVVEKNGHVVSDTVLPAIEKFVQANFAGAMAEQMRTLPGVLSNLQDIGAEALRQVGAGGTNLATGAGLGMYPVLQSFITPIEQALGDATSGSGVGATLDAFAQRLGTGLGQALQAGLGSLSRWFDQMGGLAGVIARVEQAWISFSSALRVGLSILAGVGDAIGNVLGFLRELYDAVGRLLAPMQAVFGLFGQGADPLRTLAATIVTLGVELKVLATIYDLASGALERYTALLGLNTAAAQTNATAQAAGAGLQMGAALRTIGGLPVAAGGAFARGAGGALAFGSQAAAGLGAAAMGDVSLITPALMSGLGLISTGFTALSEAIVATIGPFGVFLADMYLVPRALSDAITFIQTLRGIDVAGLQTGLGLGIPHTTYSTPPVAGVEVPGLELRTPFGIGIPIGGGRIGARPGIESSGPGAFGAYLQSTIGPDAYRDWAEFIQHQRPGDFISMVQRLAPEQEQALATEYGREGGSGGAAQIGAIYQGTAAGLRPEQQANVFTAFNQAVAKTAQDAASKWGQQFLQGDVQAQVEAYGAREGALRPELGAAGIGALVDRYATGAYGRYRIPLPAGFGTPRGATSGPSQDELAAIAQAAQQVVGWDEVLKVPYVQFKKDMDAAVAAMHAAGDPDEQVKAFYKQHMDAWAKAQAQLAQDQLTADEAMHAPYATIQRDMNNLASKLATEGDTAAQIAAKMGQTVEQYFSTLISATEAQRQALATIGAPESAQLALVGTQQDQMRQENAQLAARGLPPKFTPQEIAAAGITGTRQVQAPFLQQAETGAQATYDLALQQNRITQLSQILPLVTPIVQAHVAQLINQGTPPGLAQQEGQLEQLRLIRQGQDAILSQRRDIFQADLDSKASDKQLRLDELAVLQVVAAETGANSPQYKLAKAQMDREIAGRSGADAARPPEPHYGTYGSLTATGAGYGQAVVTYGTQLRHDPWEQMVGALREQVQHLKDALHRDDLLLAEAKKTSLNTQRTADATAQLILPPFPSTQLSHAGVPRAVGGHTPIRRP